jgi:Uma2 family endonuclease
MNAITEFPFRVQMTFEDFLERYPNDGHYEWVNGEIIDMRATRQHDNIANFIMFAFHDQIRQHQLNYVVTNTAVIRTKTLSGLEQGRKPDVSVISRKQWEDDRQSYAALIEPIELAVEVVSTNWDDDYLDKLEEYQYLGIKEYWIVDYLALGSRDYLGKPKQPAILIFQLDEQQRYQSQLFRDEQIIVSKVFPRLQLTAQQILKA